MPKLVNRKPMKLELYLQKLIWGARWLQAPIYLALCFVMLAFIYEVCISVYELFHLLGNRTLSETDLILSALTLCDVVLIANLLLIVIISGYENFVSTIHVDPIKGDPLWIKELSHDGVKMKIAASLVAISSIQLLRQFLDIAEKMDKIDPAKYQYMWQIDLFWYIIVHLIFVLSALLLALMKRWEGKENVI